MITSITITSQPAFGQVSVTPDNKISFVKTFSDQTGMASFSYDVTYDDAPTESKTQNILVETSPQAAGFPTGESIYMLEEDANGELIIETGPEHRKLYLTASGNGLTAADIATTEGITVGEVTNNFLIANPSYGGSEGMALDFVDLGKSLWESAVGSGGEWINGSQWLLLEKGYEYDMSGTRRWMRGERSLHPKVITSYGSGAKAKLTVKGDLDNNGRESNIVFRDVAVSFYYIGRVNNFIFENVDIYKSSGAQGGTEEEPVDGFTVRNSRIADIWRTSPGSNTYVGADGIERWSPFTNRAAGFFWSAVRGLFFENCVIDRCGWDPTFVNTGAITGGHPPNMFSHNVYINWNVRDQTVRNCITMRSASYGLKFRGDGFVENVFSLDNSANLESLGGDYEGRGPVGGYHTLLSNVTTRASLRYNTEGDLQSRNDLRVGAKNWGYRNGSLLSCWVDNMIVHSDDPLNPEDEGQSALNHYNGADGYIYDDTIVWRWQLGNGDIGNSDNVEGLDTAVMNATTIETYVSSKGIPIATDEFDLAHTNEATASYGLFLRGLSGSAIKSEVTEVLDHFRQGFGIDTTKRTVAQTVSFVPDPRSDSVRWDNRMNWDTGDSAGFVAGDSADLRGNKVVFHGTVALENLIFGKWGGLIVTHGKLSVGTDFQTAEYSTLDISNAGQVWVNGTTSGTESLDVTMSNGRFAVSGTYSSPVSITATAGQVFAATGAELTFDYFEIGPRVQVGFDGTGTGTATLSMRSTSEIRFVTNGESFAEIKKFYSGSTFEQSNENVSTVMNLDGDLIVDLAGYTGGAATLPLISVDTLNGAFATTQFLNVPVGLSAVETVTATGVNLVITSA